MELHNKKSDFKFELGKELFIENTKDGRIKVLMLLDVENNESVAFFYDSLEEFNKSWEDYRPAEALIKDPKIRKAVRAWAEVNDVKRVTIEKDFSTYAFYPTDTDRVSISVWTEPSLSNLSRGKIYTIEELCGEEE